MIIKDDTEVEMLDRCLDSVQNYVDGVFLTVTRPNQKNVAECAKRRGLHLSEFKWDMGDTPWINWDFSKARNFNWSQVPKGYDWMFWLDTDDIFVGGEYLRDVAETSLNAGTDTVFFSYWYGCTFKGEPSLDNLVTVDIEHLRERLIRPNITTWKGKLHETPVPLEGVKIRHSPYSYDANDRPIAVMHTLSIAESKEKLDRNKTILELELKEQGKDPDPRTLLYLMKIYTELDGMDDKIIEYGKVYLEKSGWDEERMTCCEMVGNAYAKKGEYKTAVDYYLRGIAEWPNQPLIYLRLAQTLFNMKKYRDCRHWLKIGMDIPVNNSSTLMNNYTGMKMLASELLLKIALQVEKNTKKSVEAAKLLYGVSPTPEHASNVEYLENADRLNDACKNVDELVTYLEDIGNDYLVPAVLDTLPVAISSQPFAIKARQRNAIPKKWGKDEICYFANFGGPHFEKWDGNSLKKGIGGSETAVIRLSEEWVKQGYKVAVYGDPEKPCTINGVVYLPWYWFNSQDKFNIFIQWRGWGMCNKIKCKKFMVDLHDIFAGIDVDESMLPDIDRFMVKSQYHRDLAKNIPDYKFKIISNGI